MRDLLKDYQKLARFQTGKSKLSIESLNMILLDPDYYGRYDYGDNAKTAVNNWLNHYYEYVESLLLNIKLKEDLEVNLTDKRTQPRKMKI